MTTLFVVLTSAWSAALAVICGAILGIVGLLGACAVAAGVEWLAGKRRRKA